ncbi:MAG: hypothetical protein OXE94_11550 [Aestuariivita sp.]|nr:hypothetical protein [Aestuariivita sp.]MCY4202081.1 hypothetical protein [Aestuariivita sp.]
MHNFLVGVVIGTVFAKPIKETTQKIWTWFTHEDKSTPEEVQDKPV